MKRLGGNDWGRSLALFTAGAVAAAILISPAGAHIGSTIAHLWSNHLRANVSERVKALSYTKAQSDRRFSSAVKQDTFGEGPVPNVQETVASVVVPRGDYLIQGRVEATGGDSTTLDCVLMGSTRPLATADHVYGPGNTHADLHLLHAARFGRSTSGFRVVSINCADNDSGAAFEEGRLIVQRVTGLEG